MKPRTELKQPVARAAQISERKVSDIMRGQKTKSIIHKQAETYQAGIAAMVGMGNKALATMTNLSLGQVSYRLVRTGASAARKEYREGRGPVAEFLLNKARPFAEAQFVELMREKLGLQQP